MTLSSSKNGAPSDDDADQSGDGTSAQAQTQNTPAATGPAGKAYFTSTVHPMLAQKCGSCHDVGGIGSPTG